MKKAFVINGPGRAGKGTFIKMCRLFLSQNGVPVYSFSSILPIKLKLVENKEWDGQSEKTEKIRSRMAELKRQMSADGDIPTRYLVDSFNSVSEGALFFHIREATEIRHAVRVFKSELKVKLGIVKLIVSDFLFFGFL